MRVFVACLMALGIAVSPAIAGNGGAADKTSAATAETSNASSAEANSGNPPEAAKANTPATPAEAGLENELQELRELIESQQKQLQAESQQLKDEQQQMQALRNQLSAFAPAAEGVSATGSSSLNAVAAPVSAAISAPVTANGALSPNPAPAGQQGFDKNPPQNQSLTFKGITLTPGGYFAAETVYRNRALGSDINSSLSAVPLPGNEQSHISEFNASGRQSRIAMLAQGKLKSVTIGGYYEADFLSAGVTSNDNQSNSYTLRQRQFWGQAKLDNGLTVTGGQMWSLVTETRNAMDNRTETTPQTIDAQYNVGFSWARQYGLRVVKNIGSEFWLAAAVEEAQTTVATPACVVGTAGTGTCSATQNPANFLVGSFGVSGGLYNPTANYAFNAAPDFVVKAVFQPKGWGHYEVFGLLTTPRDRVYPCEAVSATTSCGGVTGPSGALAFNDTTNGGGIGANARARFFKHLDLGAHFFGGDGIGRYGSVGLSQVTIRPNGMIAPIHNYQSLGTVELFTNKLDV
jgi:TolA-binding protein